MFCRQLFFSQVDCSVLRCLKIREGEREEDLQEYLLSSLSFVCELEVLKNYVGPSPLSSPHSVSLLMWGVFFCYLRLSTFQLCSLWGIFLFFSGVNFGTETHWQKLHTEMQQRSDSRQCRLWAWLSTVTNVNYAETQRQRTFTAKMSDFFFFFILLTYFIIVPFWV